MLPEDLKEAIVKRILRVNPQKIVLFGSYASGDPGKDSDVDLLVVTDDNFMPTNFSEKNALYLSVAAAITDIGKRIPIDLIVHTKPMHNKFNKLGSMFSRKIASSGIVLYEKTD